MEFVAGDIVRLKSGGPNMMVERILGDVGALCVWFDEEGRRRRARFTLEAIEKVTIS